MTCFPAWTWIRSEIHKKQLVLMENCVFVRRIIWTIRLPIAARHADFLAVICLLRIARFPRDCWSGTLSIRSKTCVIKEDWVRNRVRSRLEFTVCIATGFGLSLTASLCNIFRSSISWISWKSPLFVFGREERSYSAKYHAVRRIMKLTYIYNNFFIYVVLLCSFSCNKYL